jgi:hypothetical protein
MIGEREEAAAIRRYLNRSGHTVLASAFNLLELRSIPTASTLSRDLGVLRSVTTTFEEYPLPYRHAREVFNELRRVHPEWLRVTAPQGKIRSFLKYHREEWFEFKEGGSPKGSIAAYRAAAEPGNAINRQVQKLMRAQQSASEGRLYLVTELDGKKLPETEIDLNDPEINWRVDCLSTWSSAIVGKHQSGRDYADYLGPYLKPVAFVDPTAATEFWMRRVHGVSVPLNRTAGLAHYFQTHHKISHGNSLDTLHACYMHDVDVLLTADKAFFAVLEEVAKFIEKPARVVLIDRSSPSVLAQICRLDDIG